MNKNNKKDIKNARVKLEAVRLTYKEYLNAAQREKDYRERVSGGHGTVFSEIARPEYRGNRTEEKLVRLLTYGEETKASEKHAAEVRRNAETLIDSLENENERKILRLRYIDFRSWNDIIDILRYERSWVYRLHNRGLCNIEKVSRESE